MKENKNSRKARRLRKKRRLMRIRIGILLAIAAAACLCVTLARKEKTPTEVAPLPSIEPTATTYLPTEIPATPTPTVAPTPTPIPTENPHPHEIGLYIPEGGLSSDRIRQSVFYGEWVREKDIDCFEVIASNRENVSGTSHKDMFMRAWESYADTDGYKIGFHMRYALDDGREISYTIRTPKDVMYTEYVECWIYDDVHQDSIYYSHLKESRMREDTLMTSIKLTCGRKIAHVTEIHLTAFIYSSEEDFDASGAYIGDVSCEITILRE